MSDVFTKHLDECKQCEEHPFDLCPTGMRLLEEAVAALDGTINFGPLKAFERAQEKK